MLFCVSNFISEMWGYQEENNILPHGSLILFGQTKTVRHYVSKLQSSRMLCNHVYISNIFISGIPIRTTLDNSTTVQYAGVLQSLTVKAKSAIREIDPQNELTFLRIRSRKHEIMVAPGTCICKPENGNIYTSLSIKPYQYLTHAQCMKILLSLLSQNLNTQCISLCNIVGVLQLY